MKELLIKFMGEQEAGNRKTLSVDGVPLDESGLRELLVCTINVHFALQFNPFIWGVEWCIENYESHSFFRQLKRASRHHRLAKNRAISES